MVKIRGWQSAGFRTKSKRGCSHDVLGEQMERRQSGEILVDVHCVLHDRLVPHV
jgi:hypothetical protein